MKTVRILADDLTGALDCAAAFGAGVPVHLGHPGPGAPAPVDIVATATRDVAAHRLPQLLAPLLPWLAEADIAFKKVDSLLRGNTFDEVDHVARAGGFGALVFAPAFPAQARITESGRQWWLRPGGERSAVGPQSIAEALRERGWQAASALPEPGTAGTAAAWVPDVRSDEELDAVAAAARRAPRRLLWCGSAGLAHAMARSVAPPPPASRTTPDAAPGPVMLVSASHHPVSREQWRVLRQSARAPDCLHAGDPAALCRARDAYPALLDLSPEIEMTPAEAAALLARQAALIATHAPRPRTAVVVGGDTLLALCQALGAHALSSEQPLQRTGWGSARMLGGCWDGVVCHTRSGAFGGPRDLEQVLDGLA
ncbi:four-carbon acid sugar kinase family protein [Caldimonas tepidiphila]|uniref:four-carbon acid sugar kinase family protein n=1 Tax=Caldimonas tepidiphila TaxID=2315841 RepID=UPI000E5C45BC|nr:four-carbon acid sugar kinase family protein [Caldimonas tepidiphila]